MTSAPVAGENDTDTIALGPRMARSSQFDKLFAEGMQLVEEAASYLDGPGRIEAADLAPCLAAAYSAESMRLTARLMQLASWLMLRRALERGDVSAKQALEHPIALATQAATTPRTTFLQLPAPMQHLTDQSLQLQRRVVHLDRMISAPAAEAVPPASVGPAEQLALLRSAFESPGL